jgi:hypothetical protein
MGGTRQTRLFGGVKVDETRMRVKGGVDIVADQDLALGDVVEFAITGHVCGVAIEIVKDGDGSRIVRTHVIRVDSVKVSDETAATEPEE